MSELKEGDRVKVRGLPGIHVVTRPFSVQAPTIVKNQFTMAEVAMVKFITAKETYYAYAQDCSVIPAEPKGSKKAR